MTSDGKSTTKSFSLSCNSVSEGTINFTVTGDITSGDGETKDISLSKQVSVTRAKSSNNSLSDLKVDGTTVSGFSGSKTSYILSDNSGTSINISATASDSNASVSGTGSKSLKYGKNTFTITVTAENGSKKTYSITVNKPDPRSKNNYLKELKIDAGTIEFNKDTTNYLVKVEHNINEVNITAISEDSKSTVSGTGKKTIEDYTNEFEIVVKAENETTRTYIIKVVRKDASGNYGKLSTDNSVKTISITNYSLDFNPEVKKYNLLVEDINEVEINVETNDSTASVSILNNTELKAGLNKVTVKVTAENGDINEYLFNVYKIGEEKEIETNNETTEEKQNNEKTNIIWLIISGVEFLIIIVLSIFILKKKKSSLDVSDNDSNKNNENNETNETTISSVESQAEIKQVDEINPETVGENTINQEEVQKTSSVIEIDK